MAVKTVLGSHFGGFSAHSLPILGPILVLGLVDVHWYDLEFEPWPSLSTDTNSFEDRIIRALLEGGALEEEQFWDSLNVALSVV